MVASVAVCLVDVAVEALATDVLLSHLVVLTLLLVTKMLLPVHAVAETLAILAAVFLAAEPSLDVFGFLKSSAAKYPFV